MLNTQTHTSERRCCVPCGTQGSGGGNLGIVTSFTVRPVAAPDVVTVVSYAWPLSALPRALHWFQVCYSSGPIWFAFDTGQHLLI